MKQILNVHGRLCKIALVALTLMFATSFAQVSLNVEIDARMRGLFNQGVNSLRANYYDAGKLKIGATIDNVTAEVVFSRNSDSSTGSPALTDATLVPTTDASGVTTYSLTRSYDADYGNFLLFDTFTLEVKDLFSGLLSAKFYNWGFGAGKSIIDDNQLLSDIDLVGAYFTFQPVDIFGFGLGYGFHGLGENSQGRNTVHGIKAHASLGGPVPVNLYVGATMTHGYTVTLAEDANGLGTAWEKRPFGIERLQVGVDADFYKGWVKASIGFTLPMGSAVSYISAPGATDIKKDFILIGGVDGSIPFGDTGFSLDYAAYYVTQAFAKSLPNATDDDLHDSFDDVMFKARIRPKYSLGIFAVQIEADVFMQEVWSVGLPGTTTDAVSNLIKAGVANDAAGFQLSNGTTAARLARYVKPTEKPRNPLGMKIEPKITITFAPGMSVDLLYALEATELSDRVDGTDSQMTHTIGMNVKAKFGYTAE